MTTVYDLATQHMHHAWDAYALPLATQLAPFFRDANLYAVSTLPAIAYYAAVAIYGKGTKGKPAADRLRWKSDAAVISAPLSNMAIALPLFHLLSSVYPLNPLRVILGCLWIDTVEYWSHRVLHTRWLFNNVHFLHHSVGKPVPEVSFVNHEGEIFFTTPGIVFGSIFLGLSYAEFCVVTGLAFAATVCDHACLHPRAFHVLHHCGDRNTNFQQPFFTFWDRLLGTYNPKSLRKVPFVVT